jgi:hypothetical protein
MAVIALRRFPAIPPLLALGPGLGRLAGIGLLAIGISGVVALAGGRAFGKDFVSGDPPDVTYTANRCAELLEYYPGGTCRSAATAHHFDEIVSYRIAAGVLGLLIVAGERLLVPGSLRRQGQRLPAGIIDTAGVTAFGLAAAALFGLGVSHLLVVQPQLALSFSGSGQWLSGAIVAAPVAVYFGLRLLSLLDGGGARAEVRA